MAADNSAYKKYNEHSSSNGNAAYGNYKYYHRPAERKPAEKPAPVPEITMKLTPPKRGSVFKVLLVSTIGLLVLFSVIYGRVERDKMYRYISNANAQYESVRSENVRLQSELESKMTLKNIEEYAVSILGLQKLDNSQIEYVQTQTDDVVEIPEEEKNIFVKIKDKFDGFVEYIFG